MKSGHALFLPLRPGILLLIALLVSTPARAGPDFAVDLQLGGQTLLLNGSGTRKKVFVGVYDAALYLSNRSGDADAIIGADEPMAISIVITSRLISARRLSSAMEEGFERATDGRVEPIGKEIAAFQAALGPPIGKGDRLDLLYTPGAGVRVFRNGGEGVAVESLAFKQALFAIWLGHDPVQPDLKRALLGGAG